MPRRRLAPHTGRQELVLMVSKDGKHLPMDTKKFGDRPVVVLRLEVDPGPEAE
jgi:hypothetical protein